MEPGPFPGAGPSPAWSGWSAHSEREWLMRSCPAKAAQLAYAQTMAPRPVGIAGEVRARRDLGLRADQLYIEQLHEAFAVAGQLAAERAGVSGGMGGWSTSWGFLMSEDEERGLWGRQEELGPLVTAAHSYLDALPVDLVGGVWQDLAENGIVVTLTAGADPETVVGDLSSVAGPGQHVRAVCVRWSTSQLTAIGDTVLHHIGRAWTSHGVDVMNGVFSLGVADNVPATERAVAQVADPCAVHVHESRPVSLVAVPCYVGDPSVGSANHNAHVCRDGARHPAVDAALALPLRC